MRTTRAFFFFSLCSNSGTSSTDGHFFKEHSYSLTNMKSPSSDYSSTTLAVFAWFYFLFLNNPFIPRFPSASSMWTFPWELDSTPSYPFQHPPHAPRCLHALWLDPLAISQLSTVLPMLSVLMFALFAVLQVHRAARHSFSNAILANHPEALNPRMGSQRPWIFFMASLKVIITCH